MNDYIFLMHGDSNRASGEDASQAWGPYVEKLKASGCFQGGSSMGNGVCVNKAATEVALSSHLVGFIRVRAENLAQARELLTGNPVFEAGGTMGIRELPKD